jgi:sugar fermentation stimulation protein A
MKEIREHRPNDATHRAFGDALRLAEREGVKILAYDCIVTPDSMTIDKPIPIRTELNI